MYTSLLCLVATNEDSRKLVAQAQKLAAQFNAPLRLLHVVEYVPLTGTEDAMLTAPIAMGDELEKQAQEFMHGLADEFGISQAQTEVTSGDLTSALNDSIEAYKIDLVIVGNHCRRGLAAIFNHAEDEVLHRCACDVLAINLS